MSIRNHSGCRELWVQVAWQACNEARARLEIARDVVSGVRECSVLNHRSRVRTYAEELSRIEAYFRGPDFRDVCQMANLRCDPNAVLAYICQQDERAAA